MEQLPIVITTSVVRSSQQGESHGGVYLVDLHTGRFDQVIDWNDRSISWEGRGGDRGLRGIAFHQGKVYIAASDEVFVYDRQFELLESYRNNYLKHCHEIFVAGETLYLTSTEINSVLEFDLVAKRFTRGHALTYRKRKGLLSLLMTPHMEVFEFDPNDNNNALSATLAKNDLHINNVTVNDHGILISGTRIDALMSLEAGCLRKYAPVPIGTHNATTYKNGIIYNDTHADRVVVASRENVIRQSFAVPQFSDLPTTGATDYARQGFGRGLCLLDDYVIAGSSPSTVSVYDISSGKRVQMINLSKDVRNCIHGLELWSDFRDT